MTVLASISDWMPAIVAAIGGAVAIIGTGWQILDRRDARTAAAKAERDRERAEIARQEAEREKQAAVSEHAAMVAAMDAQRGHLALFMEDNQRLRGIVEACEGDCARIRAENRQLLDKVAELERSDREKESQIASMTTRLDRLTGESS